MIANEAISSANVDELHKKMYNKKEGELNMTDEKIDFVLLWVDDRDLQWQEQKRKFSNQDINNITANKYRNWDNLKYWFRGVEKFAPWVNQIFFVTCNQKPEWLNENHPKLKLINHSDFMNEDCLPTFNSNAIEINLGKVKELSEQFVLFNDDMFLLKDTKPTDFFEKGLPKDCFFEYPDIIPFYGETYQNFLLNNKGIINSHFSKVMQSKGNLAKIYNIKYGMKVNFINFILSKFHEGYIGFYNPHISQAHLKSTFQKLYKIERDIVEDTSRKKFRSYYDISHFLLRYWNLVEGKFIPSKDIGKAFNIGKDIEKIKIIIEKQKYKVACFNDNTEDINFEYCKNVIINSFEKILPEKSQFEK